MQGPVASAIHSISGEHLVHVSPRASSGLSKFNSVSIPIDAQVNAKLKAKIWTNEYFDFALLLNAGSGDTRYHLPVSSQSGSSLPTLSLEPTQKSKPITSIETWTSAFQVFVGVHTVKYPLETPYLMKYVEVAARGGDWHFYDQQFRYLRQSSTSEMPWGSTHWELWIRAQNFHNSARFTKNLTVRNSSAPYPVGSFVPKGYCRKFHRGNDCPGRSFRHQCFKCGVVHPANRCNFRSSKSASSSQPVAAKSRTANTNSN